MKINNVFADEVILLYLVVSQKLIEAACFAVQFGFTGFKIIFQTGQIADGRIHPHIKIFAGRIRKLDAEIRGIARYVPVIQIFTAIAQPLGQFIFYLGLKRRVGNPFI